MPSSTFLKAAGIWNPGKSSTGKDNVDLPIPDVQVLTAPANLDQGVPFAGLTLPAGTRLQVLQEWHPPLLGGPGQGRRRAAHRRGGRHRATRSGRTSPTSGRDGRMDRQALAQLLTGAGYTGLFLSGDASRAGEAWAGGAQRDDLLAIVEDERCRRPRAAAGFRGAPRARPGLSAGRPRGDAGADLQRRARARPATRRPGSACRGTSGGSCIRPRTARCPTTARSPRT